MKRALSVVLTIALLCAVCFNGIVANAANSGTVGNCSWELNGTILTISGNGAMDSVDKLPWGTSITKVIIEDGVTEVGNRAFYMCESLKEVSLPDSLTRIGNSSFDWCSNLREIYIPKNVSYIDAWAFFHCDRLQNISVDKNNAYYTSENGVLFNKNKTVIMRYPSNKIGNHYDIPSTVTVIEHNAFSNCGYLNSFSAPDNITKIGLNAFSYTGYSSNKSNYDNGVLYIGQYVIDVDWESSITDCILREGTKLIADGGFSAWKSLKTVVLPDGVVSIGESAFNFCDSLESIRLPQSLTSVGKGAFGECDNLKNVYYAGSTSDKNNITFGSYTGTIQKSKWNYDACIGISLHNWDVTSHIDATCANEGKEQKNCIICGKSETITLEKTQHNMGKWKQTEVATCAASGMQTRQCLKCGYTENKTIEITDDHKFGKWVDDEKASCSESGRQKRVCSVCNAFETKTVAALGHSVKDYTEIKAATPTEEALIEGVCERCGETVTKTASMLENDKNTVEQSDEKVETEGASSSLKTDGNISYKWIIWVAGGAVVIAAAIVTTIMIIKKKKTNIEEQI